MYWDQITTKNFLEHIIGHYDTAILPTGSVEAHGQHCPLGTDNMAPWYFAEQLENTYSDRILILPPVPYGHTPDLSVWAGTISVSASVLQQYVAEIGIGAAQWGIKNLILLNGHGGNTPALQAAMEQIAQENVRVVLVNWWLDFSQQILTITTSQGHAGEDETSVMLAIAPDLVHMDDASFNPFRPRYRMKGPGINDKSLRHATTGDGRLGTKEKGERIAAVVVQELSQLLERLWNDDLFERTS
ncbi:creatinine amidohydrolase [Sulfobacillus thermosulfidooxidans DSM 9293]|uniref:Creatinine amidohydrolase n=2 Tax=Sulfobacillus thermosulfidooxidans TaxID=28034 RepID=A0A1W1WMR6_SULTA|nr:creatininase family protein [Sulfobacillus thermosulfidooxidans]PSR29977.1 MAG: creatininase [Sulfobacillus thermosulfidooxidans]SMC07591.1 creatinine amidohydrolase [Sulfobacillus thermosulfidooxidans DSM 9293]